MDDSSPNPSATRFEKSTADVGADFKQIFEAVWGLRYWVLVSVVVGFGLAYTYLWWQIPIYKSSASLMLISDNGRGTATSMDAALMSEFATGSVRQKIDNELYILKSTPLMQKVVENLNLNVRYYEEDPFKVTELYKKSPIRLVWHCPLPFAPDKHPTIQLHVIMNPDLDGYMVVSCSVNGKPLGITNKLYAFGDVIKASGCAFSLSFDPALWTGYVKYYVSVATPSSTARSFVGSLSVSTVSKKVATVSAASDIIVLNFNDAVSQRARDILNEIIRQYIADSREFKEASIRNSLAFINDRLVEVEKELTSIENQATTYRQAQGMLNIDSQSERILTADEKNEQELSDIGTQITLLQNMTLFLENQSSKYDIIPANFGLEDLGVNNFIEQYNTLAIERIRLLRGSSETNPTVVAVSNQLSDLRASIEISIANKREAYELQKKAIESKLQTSKNVISTIPTQQVELAQIDRRKDIIEPLYMLLQEKKEDTMISLYALTDNAKMVEPAAGSSKIYPQNTTIYLYALITAFFLPIGIYFIKSGLRKKIIGKQDVERNTTIPVFASIPQARDSKGKTKLIDIRNKDSLTESFRLLRSNLQFTSGKVFLITSSLPGEGKSFVAANLAISLASAEKKVLLIGLDLRKPKVAETFNIESKRGLVNYLIGREQDIFRLIFRLEQYPNLDLLPSGQIPPNPSELLSTGKVRELLDSVRSSYDYILCDTAPCFLASDTYNIAQYIDNSLYIVRAGFAEIKMLRDVQDLFEKKRLNNMVVIVNGIDGTKKSYGSSSYGYGYGYGYGGTSHKKANKKKRPQTPPFKAPSSTSLPPKK